MHDNKEKKTYGLEPEKIANLFQMASEDLEKQDSASKDYTLSDRLADRLAEPLLLSSSSARKLPGIPAMLTNALDFYEDISIGQLLSNTATSIDQLIRIKNCYGQQSRITEDKDEQSVAVVLYYAAIAAGIAYHNKKISQFPSSQLCKSFQMLREKPWINEVISELYETAIQRCNTIELNTDSQGNGS